MNPQSCITLPLGVTTYYLAKAINSNGEHARITQERKYKSGESNILLKHNLNIVYNPSDPNKLSIATAERLHMCLDHVGQLTRSKPIKKKKGGGGNQNNRFLYHVIRGRV